jgi:hypothetical protein
LHLVKIFVVATFLAVAVPTAVGALHPSTPGAVVALPGGFHLETFWRHTAGCSVASIPDGPTIPNICLLANDLQNNLTFPDVGVTGDPDVN